MDTNDLEIRLGFQHETQTFEVKQAMPWNAVALVKDFLAMANHRDGGAIVIGVRDQGFVRQGVDAKLRATYNVDIMRDQIKRYADPPIRFDVATVPDADGLEYIVITIASFERVPVVAQCDNGSDVFAGQIYYRNSNKRVESAAISNAADMLELIMTAITRTRAAFKDRGFVVASDAFNQLLTDELGGL